MQTFRILLGVIVAISASALLTQADDNPQQAAARAALMQQMGVLDTNPPPPVVAPAPPPVEKPKKEKPKKTVRKKAPKPPKKSAATPAFTSTNEMMQSQSPTEANMPSTAQQAPAQLPPLVPISTNSLTVPPVEQANVPLPPNASTNEMTSYPVNPALPQTSDKTTLPTESPVPPPPQEANPTAAPPSPISSAQQQELQDLLSRYMANQITPEQYQAERAKILGGQ
jgi:hypothetical protein